MVSDQAACSSESSSNFNSAQNWKDDVFLSFKGEDTRKNFTDHLYTELCRRGFEVFRHEEELERAETISGELLKTIVQSRFAIVVVSQNYASSSWCLEELQHIISNSRNELHLRVIPIFYDVDPSHVRKFVGEVFDRHKESSYNDKVEKWTETLMELGRIPGWDSREWYESKLIDDVVKKLWNRIYGQWPPTISDKLIGIDQRIHEIELHMSRKLDDIKFIGIWGVDGVGKTTLAEAIYERFCNQFDFHCLLRIVGGDPLFRLQKKLLSHLKKENIESEDTFKVKKTLQNHLHNKKVMLILDDVTSKEQLMSLAWPEWFGVGSRVIITTRDVHLLRSCHVDSIYEVKPMNEDESFQLFCQKAIGRDHREEAFLDKSKLAINYAGGLPLALCVLGSFCGRNADEWEKALDMLKESDNHMHEILKVGYGALTPEEKAIFLDIACFFNLWEKDEVTQILDSCGFKATEYIPTLIEKSLLAEIEIGSSKCIKMHNLIQDMGRSIVQEEYPDHVERRSRLWSAVEIDKVLENNKGTDATEGVVMPNSSQIIQKSWKSTAFSEMKNLRMLIISCNIDDDLPPSLKVPSKLKVLHWEGYPPSTLPLGTKLDELVYLKMQKSKIERLSFESKMNNLKFLDLSHSKCLTEIPDFSIFQHLERLVLEGCEKLERIDPSLGKLESLVEVNFQDCKKLKILPTELEMASLEVFVLSGCIEVRKLPEFGECMQNLSVLDVECTDVAELPESVGSLINLEILNLRYCTNLVRLPRNIHKLKRLRVLDIYGCFRVSYLPENLNENEALEKLDARGTFVERLPSSIGNLEQLQALSFHEYMISETAIWRPTWLRLPTSIFNIKSLTELDLSKCYIDDRFIPDDLGCLSSLRKLDLSENMFGKLPDGCISRLLNLRFLYLNCCFMLQLLPKPSPRLDLMDAQHCGSLSTLSDEGLWQLFASMDESGSSAEWKSHRLNADSWASISIKTFSVIIPGSEIPSWFQSQKNLRLDEEDESSIIEDVPSSNWLGFALCLVVPEDIFDLLDADEIAFCWRFYFAKACDDQFVFLQGREVSIHHSHTSILFGQIGKQTCSSLSKDYSRLHLKFDAEFERKYKLNVKCGWRVMSKTDFEKLLLPTKVHDDQRNKSKDNATYSKGDQSYHTMDEISETESPEPSSPMSEEEGESDDS